MKKTVLTFALAFVLLGFQTAPKKKSLPPPAQNIQVVINLTTITEDKVQVTLKTPAISTDEITYRIPKTVPGTYSEDNYGRYVEDLKAFDKNGNPLEVNKIDDNSWSIKKAKKLSQLTYWVNDTFDTEKGGSFGSGDVFSPAGSNIDVGKNIMLNTHCFVGYFKGFLTLPYQLTVLHPDTIWGATSMIDADASTTSDVFTTARYAELVENPIMYSKPDHTSFVVDGMDINIAVYSPTGKVTAESITPEMKKMMTAQKNFLGKINSTKKYTVLLYLSTATETDAKGFGALEHPTATTVVLPELMPMDDLIKTMKDVVSHEFFHIVTPLTIHSDEIQFFDYNNPKMSEHLWLYEGVTEYFANLFQINQGLIKEEDFYKRISEKIQLASKMDDTMSFTTMSANVLKEPYKTQYINVYQKGALIGMCIDLIIREKSNGKSGILDLMHKLAAEYGVNKPFHDKELFAKITALTYPEVGDFLATYVAGTKPIPYSSFLEKAGLTAVTERVAESVFLKGQVPYITVNPETKGIMIIPQIELNDFYKSLDIKGGDEILEINEKPYMLDNIYDMISESMKWKEDDPITVKLKRNGLELTVKGKVKLPYEDKQIVKVTDASKNELKEAWLKL